MRLLSVKHLLKNISNRSRLTFLLGEYNKKVQPQKRASRYRIPRKISSVDENSLDDIRKQGNVLEMKFNLLVKKKETDKEEDKKSLAGIQFSSKLEALKHYYLKL